VHEVADLGVGGGGGAEAVAAEPIEPVGVFKDDPFAALHAAEILPVQHAKRFFVDRHLHKGAAHEPDRRKVRRLNVE
jgi:hypothetical protein